MSDKLADTSALLNRHKGDGATLDAFKQCYTNNLKEFALLTTLYSRRFLVASSINLMIFLIVTLLSNSPDNTETYLLIMLNFMIVSSLLLSSALAFLLLGKMEKLDATINSFSADVKEYVKSTL